MRLGIIGCGVIAGIHARAIATLPDVELAGCHARDPDRARRFADEHGCPVFESVQALADDPRIDAVSICTPSGNHLEPAVVAAAAGKHVLVEKPLEVTLQRCDELISAAQSAGVTLATVFQSRCHPFWQSLRQAMADGAFGRLSVVEGHVKWFRPQSYYDSAAWRGTWVLDGGGALMNQAIHTVDLLLWLAGPVRSVAGFAALRAHERIEVEDTAVASLEFESGPLGTIAATTASCPGQSRRIEIHGDRGSAIVIDDRIAHWSGHGEWSQPPMSAGPAAGSGASDPAAIGAALHAAAIADFVRAVRTGTPPAVDGPEGRRSVELVATIYRSAREGRVIHLP